VKFTPSLRKRGRPPERLGRRILLIFLAGVSGIYGLILTLHFAYPRQSHDVASSFLDTCRELCLSYGLVSTGHIADDAQAFLNSAGPGKLARTLDEILGDREFTPVESQAHPLLGLTAPAFELPNDRGELVTLQELTREGPVVVVFYYGYGCSHCVAQLFALQNDLEMFQKLGARIVALSPDSPAHTAERFREYGRFDFPVLSDANDTVSETYGVFVRQTHETPEDRRHGTFLLDRNGRVIFAARGYQPFLDNRTLLIRILRECAPTASPIRLAASKPRSAQP